MHLLKSIYKYWNFRRWRQALIEIPDLSDYICGIILNRETVEHKHDNGRYFREMLKAKDIVFGVTLDFGPTPLHGGLQGSMLRAQSSF